MLALMFGSSVTKRCSDGTTERERSVMMPTTTRTKRKIASTAAMERGLFLRSIKSTAGFNKRCRRSERKMMKARS
jgi:hypothetical protein